MSVNNSRLIRFLEECLESTSRQTSGNNTAFRCPFCSHSKLKLEINIDTQQWQCWVCRARGSSLEFLLKKLRKSEDTLKKLKALLPETAQVSETFYVPEATELPEEFISLEYSSKDFFSVMALKFLNSRGITQEEIIKYNIGYCYQGKYKNRVIIPSYTREGLLNYFVARAFLNDYPKYLNPPITRDIILFDIFINWNYPVVLVEGVFDAIAVKQNVSPILGKQISKTLFKEFKRTGTPLYLYLDKDARKEATSLLKNCLEEGIENLFLCQTNYSDPGEAPFRENLRAIREAQKITPYSLLSIQL